VIQSGALTGKLIVLSRQVALRLVLLLSSALVCPLARAAEKERPPAALPSAHLQLARDILEELIEINTTQAFGSTKAAEAVASRLRGAGFAPADVLVVGPRPGKGNCVARLRGRDKARPILFLAHLDVVEARAEDWSEGLDPFTLTERDGFFYGRGTVDVKDEAAGLVANLIRLKQEGFVPDRDIVVALTADEEGGEANGVQWLLQERRELIDAAYCINTDAGGGQIEKGQRVRYTLQTSEKVTLNFALEVRNRGGHSSMPTRDNAIYHLARGLARLAEFDFPARLNETTRAFFARTSRGESGQTAADMQAVARVPPDPAAVARLSSASPFYNGLMRTTCVATMLEAGHARNALPQTARANVNCRILPDDSPEEVNGALARVLADERIVVRPLEEANPAPPSALMPEVVLAVEGIAADMWPGVPVLPAMDPWSTDGKWLRRAGIPTFGAPGVFYENDPNRAHGKDERIGVEEFYEGTEFLYRLMKTLGSGGGSAPDPARRVHH
jgi:acetylornithine deacetylase/succinyl-diaminopimelate desuccinylase-like protein